MNNTNGRKTKTADRGGGIPAGMIPITNDPMNPGGYRDPNTGMEYNYRGAMAWENLDGGERRYKITDRTPTKQVAGAFVGSGVGANILSGGLGPVGNTGVVGNVDMPGGVPPTSLQQGMGGPNQQMPGGPGGQQMPASLPFAISQQPAVDMGNVRADMARMPAQGMPAAPAITPEEWMAISRAPMLPAPEFVVPQRQFTPVPYIDPATGNPVATYPAGPTSVPTSRPRAIQGVAPMPGYLVE